MHSWILSLLWQKHCLVKIANSEISDQTAPVVVWPRGYEAIFMLNSTENEFFLLINVKMPTIVGILTCISGENSILCLSEPKKS